MLIFKILDDELRVMRFLSGEVKSKKIARQYVRETGRSATVVKVDLPVKKDNVLRCLNELLHPDNCGGVLEVSCLEDLVDEASEFDSSPYTTPIVRFDAGPFKSDDKLYAVKYPVNISS